MIKESRISEWVQIAASLGVFVGLLLVAVEIRESNKYATSESIGAQNDAWKDYYLAGAASEITGIMQKSYEDPYNLSTEEMMRLIHWYDSLINLYTWQLRSYELDTSEFYPAPDFAIDFRNSFASPFGRAYLEYARTWARPELVDAAIDTLSNSEPTQVPENVARIRDIMRRQREDRGEE